MAKDHSLNAAHLLVRCLENEGVKYVFGIPGEENIHFVDALNGSSIRFILVRHEQGAAFMADMYGRLTGRAGVCIATLGPGAINLLLGVADAHTDSAPLVAISAQVALSRIYKESHQGVDLVAMFRPVTKWADISTSARRDTGDGPQGVQARADRAARRGVSCSAGGHRAASGRRVMLRRSPSMLCTTWRRRPARSSAPQRC